MSKFSNAILGLESACIEKTVQTILFKLDTNFFLDAFSNELVIHYRKIDVCSNLETLF